MIDKIIISFYVSRVCVDIKNTYVLTDDRRHKRKGGKVFHSSLLSTHRFSYFILPRTRAIPNKTCGEGNMNGWILSQIFLAFSWTLPYTSGFFSVSPLVDNGKLKVSTSRLGLDLGYDFSTIDAFYKNQPYAAAFATCAIKASSSDAIAQRAVERIDKFGWRRNISFIVYGGLYQGMAQYFIFNQLYPKIFGDGTDVITVAEKVLFDQLVLTPFLCLPVAYLVKAAAFSFSPKEGISRYADDCKNNNLLWKYWLIWTPTQCVTFSIVPEHLRIPFIAAVSFIWLIILSSITSKNDDDRNTNIICYDNECLIIDEINFVGPASLITEDAQDAGCVPWGES